VLPDTGDLLHIYHLMKVIDNFLPIDVFENIQRHITGIPWFFQNSVAGFDDEMSNANYMYTHMIYEKNQRISSLYNELLPLVEHPELDVKALLRIMINSYPYTNKLLKHAKHTDYEYSHKGVILYLNTCDGYTWCQGEKVYSVANRVLIHDPSIPHHSTNTTNDQRRIICNMNYL